jgi:hypothetical protein
LDAKFEVTPMPDLFHQTAPAEPYSAEVSAFADRLEEIMADGTCDIAAIAAALNARGVVAAGHERWTPESLAAYFAELAGR